MAIHEMAPTIAHLILAKVQLSNELGMNWNFILWVIGACSILGFTVFIERLLQLRRAEIDTNQFILKMRRTIQGGNFVEAMQQCESVGGTIARIVQAGLARHHRGKEQIEQAMEITGAIEIAKLEKNTKILSIIANLSPLLGLLGTVLGFIQAFAEMRLSGLVDISATRLGEAMEYALVTTAAGLAVAIPCVIAYNYLVSRVEDIVLEIQTASAEIVDLLVYPERD